MKHLASIPSSRSPSRASQKAFTLVEMTIASGVFLLIVAGMVYSQLFGLKMYNISQSKLSAADNARETLNNVRRDVRSATLLYVGNITNASSTSPTFTHITSTNAHIGNAIEIHPTTATNIYIWYYRDSTTNSLVRQTNNSNYRQIIAKYITNSMIFQAEDCFGNVLTNDVNNRVIHMTLQFYQWEFPITMTGSSNSYYDYYQLQTRIAIRTVD